MRDFNRAIRGEKETTVSVGALKADEPGDEVTDIGEETAEEIPTAADLFSPSTTARVIVMQNVVPILSTLGALGAFYLLFAVWW